MTTRKRSHWPTRTNKIKGSFTRRRFLTLVGAAAASGAAGALYGRWGESHWLELTHTRIPAPASAPASRPARILHLSDFHASPEVPLEFLDEAVSLALGQQPDVFALTGDFFTDRLREPTAYAAILGRLSAAAPTLACFGNHDGGPWTRKAGGNPTLAEALKLLADANITCLINDAAELNVRGRPFQFIGVGDLWSGMCDPAGALARTPPRLTATRILLNHNPDAKDLLQPFDWDVMLCGHTHGGQVRLPFLGTPFAPVVDRRYVQGLHRWDNRWLYVTRGVGNLHGFRFNCRPEVSVVEIM